jgi:hypothetical protein
VNSTRPVYVQWCFHNIHEELSGSIKAGILFLHGCIIFNFISKTLRHGVVNNNNNNNNNSILYFNMLTQQLQGPITESAQEDKRYIIYKVKKATEK